jgi:quinoprotein glucose dehydrogenase
LDQINGSNVSRLKVTWTSDSGDAFPGCEIQSNPIVVGGVLYATTPTMKVIALNAVTVRELWTFDPSGDAPRPVRFRHRGVTVHKRTA